MQPDSSIADPEYQGALRWLYGLSPNVRTASEIVANVHALWTFPLKFAEIVWGDGQTTHREVIDLPDVREFGDKRFRWRAKAAGWKWARVAVWDVAGNGAFVNPLWRP